MPFTSENTLKHFLSIRRNQGEMSTVTSSDFLKKVGHCVHVWMCQSFVHQTQMKAHFSQLLRGCRDISYSVTQTMTGRGREND